VTAREGQVQSRWWKLPCPQASTRGRLSLRHRTEIAMIARAPAGEGAPPIRAVMPRSPSVNRLPRPEKGQARELDPDLRSGPVP
jgi:hypothetical protein